MRFHILFSIVLPLALFQCSQKAEKRAKPDVVLAGIDSTVRPGDDFFHFAHGRWIKNNPIPPSESNWGIHKEIQLETYARLRKISEEASTSKAEPGTNAQKIGDFWKTAMDSTSIEQAGVTPVQPFLSRLENAKNKGELTDELAEIYAINSSPFAGMYVGQDDKNSEKMALFIYQAGLGLPDRDYYLNTDARTKSVRAAYQKHITRIFQLSGKDSVTAGKMAANIFNLEVELAKASRKLEDLRDPYANYNKMAVADLDKAAKGFPWSDVFNTLSIKTDSVIVGQPEFIKRAGELYAALPIETLRAYLSWNYLRAVASKLNNSFVQENFSFFGTTLQGQKTLKPRWKRVLDQEENYMGDMLGQLFVEKYYSEKTKQRYEKLVDNMLDTYQDHIETLDWMTDSTKQKALVKLRKIGKKVGYPTKWKNYSDLNISRDSYFGNVINCQRWAFNHNISKLNKPVDREEWVMTPQTWNAYYSPSNNEIVLPAAIFFIPGYEDEEIDDAVVYGYAAASTIGHELVHAFDDQGSKYDENGNLKNWWTKTDEENFKKRVDLIVRQFDAYVALDSMHINGKATAGENIADLAGLMIALDAFKKTEQYKEGVTVGGLTPIQRFFLGYALSWKINYTNELLTMVILSDVHSPPYLRVNGPFSDIPEFYEAFNVTSDQALWRPDSTRVKIW